MIIIGGLGLFVNFFPFNSITHITTKETEYRGIIDNINREPELGEYFTAISTKNGMNISDFSFWPSSHEYASEGDSIIKPAGTLMIIIKKPDGSSQKFFYQE